MVAEVFAGLGAIKTAFDIAKGLKEIDDAAHRNAAVIELQEKILAAQSAQSDLIEHVRALEIEVAELKAWDTDKRRYKLSDVGGGSLAYVIEEKTEDGEQPHSLCAQCYNQNIKSILQPEIRYPGRCDVLVCHRCGSALYLTGAPHPDHFKNRRSR